MKYILWPAIVRAKTSLVLSKERLEVISKVREDRANVEGKDLGR